LVHDVLDACFDRCVDQGLALGEHGDRVPGQQVHPVHPGESMGADAGDVLADQACGSDHGTTCPIEVSPSTHACLDLT
jgi:hypothetical protein